MEAVWSYSFSEVLHVNSTDYPVLLTEQCLNPSADRERIAEIMFETFHIPKHYLAQQPALSLLASTRTTGCVVSSGDGVTQVVCVVEGRSLPHTVQSLNIAGRDLTDHLVKIIQEGGLPSSAVTHEAAREMKEQLIYIPYGLNEEMGISKHRRSKFYQLPDGSGVTLDDARILCPEVLFRPPSTVRGTATGHVADGIQQCVADSVALAPADRQAELYENILLAGGSTLIPGFADRLTKEVQCLAPAAGQGIIVYAPEDRRNSAWIGGSIQASLPGFWDEAVTRAEYEEFGPSIVHRKCCT
jgi:actin-related protein